MARQAKAAAKAQAAKAQAAEKKAQEAAGQRPCLTNPEVRAVRNGALETGPVSWVQAPNPGFRSEPGVQAPFLGIRSRF